jgi:hypothetical protein
MLVLLGPGFAGGEADYQRLSKITGLLAYDLRARLKPGSWGLLKVLADERETERLVAALAAGGFPVVAVAREVLSDPERPIVSLKGLAIQEQDLTLLLGDREMSVPAAALCCIVRGEAQVGKASQQRASGAGGVSSSTFRAVVPDAADLQVFRESMPPHSFEAFAAADLHFHSVKWIARIDARAFDFAALGIAAASPAGALDTLVDRLGLLARVRVDRAARVSSINSFTQQAAKSAHGATAGVREVARDDRFDPYSRVLGEAERSLALQTAAALAASTPAS